MNGGASGHNVAIFSCIPKVDLADLRLAFQNLVMLTYVNTVYVWVFVAHVIPGISRVHEGTMGPYLTSIRYTQLIPVHDF